VSFGLSSNTITASVKTDYQSSNANYLTSQSNQAVSGSNGSFTFQTISFGNSNGLSFYTSNGSVVGSYTTPAGTNSSFTVSAGTRSETISQLVFSNSNGISFGLTGGTVTATVKTDYQSSGAYLTTAMLSNAVTISNINVSGGTTSSNLSNFKLIDSNGVSWSLDTGSKIYASVKTDYQSSGAYLTTQSGQAFSADASSTFQTLVLQDSNGISFSNNAGSLRLTHGLQYTSATSNITSNALNTSASRVINIVAATNNTGGGTASLSSNVSFSNVNGATFYTSAGNAVALSYTVPTQSNQNISLFALGNTTQNSSTVLNASNLSFNGLGIVTMGYSNGSVQVSASQSTVAQNISLFALNQTTQNSSTALSANALSIAGRGIVTVGYSNGSIQISATEVAQTNQTVGVYASSQTTGSASSATYDARSLSIIGAGIISIGNHSTSAGGTTTGIIISASQSADTAKAGTGFTSAGNNIGLTGTLNTNGLSLSATVAAQTNQTVGIYASSQTTGSASSGTYDARSLSFIGAGAISIGNHSTSAGGTTTGIIISAPVQSVQTQNVHNLTLSGNSTSAGAGYIQVSSGTLTLAGGNNITLSQNGNAITISGPNVGGAQTGISGIAASNTTYTSGSVTFRDGNGISWASTTGQQISITHDLQFTSNTSAITSNALNTSASSRFIQNWKLTGNTAGTTSSAQGSDLWLAGGNGVTISGSSNTLSFSVATNYQSQGAYLTTAMQSNAATISNINVSGGTTSSNLSNFKLIDSNGVSWSLDTGSKIYATVKTDYLTTAMASNASTQFVQANAGFNGTNASGTIASNSISVSVAAQTNQTIGIYGSSQTTGSASSGTYDARSLSFIGAGIISIGNHSTSAGGTTNGVIISAIQSVDTNKAGTGFTTAGNNIGLSGTLNTNGLSLSATVAAQTNQTVGLYALGNTTQNSSTTLDARTLSLNGLGNITVGYSNGSVQISGSQSTVPQNVSLFALGNTTQNSSSQLSVNALSLNAIGSLTIGYSNGSIQFSAPNALTTQSVQTQSRFNLTLSGNSTSGGGGYIQISSGVMTLAGGNNITLSQDGNAVTISAGAGGAATAISGVIGSNTTYTSGSVSLRDLNGISWQSTTGQAFQITHDLQYTSNTSNITSNALNTSASRVQAIMVGTATNAATNQTSVLSGTITLSNLNGISFYSTASGATSGIAASYTVPTVTNSSFSVQDSATTINPVNRIAFSTGNNITLSLSTGASSVTVGVAHNLAGTSTGFTGGASISGSMTHNSSGLAISLSHPAWISSQTNQTVGMYAVSNTTQNSSTTLDARTLSFQGAGVASVGFSNGSVIISVPSGGGGLTNINVSGGTTSSNLSNFKLIDSNGVSWSLDTGSKIYATVKTDYLTTQTNQTVGVYASSQTTGSVSSYTYDARSLSIIGAGGISIGNNSTSAGGTTTGILISAPATSSLSGTGQVSIAINGATISIGVPNPYISSYQNLPSIAASSLLTWGATSLSHAAAFNLPEQGSFSFIRIPALMTTNSTTIATLASATASASGALYSTINAVVYSLGVGASSKSLQYVTSGQGLYTMSQQISVTNSTQASYSLGFTAEVEGQAGRTNLTTQYSVSNTNYSFTTNQIATNFSSARFLDIPFAASLSAGPYWMIVGMSSSSASGGAAGLAALTNCNVRYSGHYGVSQAVLSMGVMGSTNLSTQGLGAGSFSTAGGGTTNSLPISAISSMASNAMVYFQMLRSA
jgi:hypothetical protein